MDTYKQNKKQTGKQTKSKPSFQKKSDSPYKGSAKGGSNSRPFGKPTAKKPMGARNRQNSEMLYIGNLNYNIKERDLVGIFGRYGKVGHVKLVIDLKTKRSKGIAFVEMFDKDDAAKAIAALDGKSIDGRMAKVSMAIPQK